MVCPKCGSENVNIQIVTDTKTVSKGHGCLYSCTIGPIIWFIKWFFFTVPALFFKLIGIGGKKQKVVTTQKKVAICQNCGHSFETK